MKESIFTDTIADMNWCEIAEKGKDNISVEFTLVVIEEHGSYQPLGTDTD